MPASQPAPYRRRKLVVNRPLQYRFVGAMLIFLCSAMAATLACVYFALWVTLYTFELLDDPVTVSLFTTAGLVLTFELLILGPLVIWMGIRLTHKVAGPLVRIHAALADMTQGNYEVHLTLRKRDALKGLADDINQLAAALRRHRPG